MRQSNLVLKLKLVKGHGYGTYTVEGARKEHKAEESITADAIDESADDENAQSIPFVTYINNIMHSLRKTTFAQKVLKKYLKND